MTSTAAVSPIDVAIVNHNTRDMLRECLASLQDQPSLGTIRVADNGSADGSMAMVESEFPDVDLVSLPHNPGFGAGNNALIARSDADVVMVLNADARIDPGALTTLGTYLRDHPDVAIAGPRITHDDGSLQRSCFDDPTVAELLWQESGAHRLRRGELANFDHATSRSVPWVLGAAMAIRRSAFDAVGGFDPGFFLYYEETDLCRRLRAAGHEIHFVADAGVMHHGGSSTGQHSELSQRTLYRSLRRYHQLHDSARPLALRGAVTAIMSARVARDSIRGLVARDETARANLGTWTAVLRDARNDWPAVDRPGVAGESPGPEPHLDDAEPIVAPQRLDWLVLLPESSVETPVVAVLGTYGDDDLKFIAAHFGIEDVQRDADSGPIDVLIVAATSSADVALALSNLATNGIAYIARAQHAGGFMSPRNLAAAATATGATVLSQHWILPNITAPRRHVPLDHAEALRWYLDRLFIASGPAQHVARRAMRTAPASALAVARAHSIVVTRHPIAPAAAAATLSGVDNPASVGTLVMTSGHDVGSRTIALPFLTGKDEPPVVVKVSARPAMNQTTRREHTALRSLHDVLPADLADTVPRPIDLVTWHERLVSTESLLSGPSLEVELRRVDDVEARNGYLADVTEWTSRLHEHTAVDAVCDEVFIETWFAEPFRRYLDAFDTDDRVATLFARSVDAARSLDGATVPIVRRHVDLGPWNIICTTTDGAPGLGIIDWESAGNRPSDGRGLPFCDLDYFIKYWLHIAADATTGRAEAALFGLLGAPDHVNAGYTTAARCSIDSYCERVGVDPRLVPALAVHNWVEQALYGSARDDMLERSHTAMSASAFIDALAARADELFA